MVMRQYNKVLATIALAVLSFGSLLAQDDVDQSSGYQILKKYFIDGDWRFMAIVLVCLILGLAFCIERIITLNLASTNTDKLLNRISERLEANDVVGAQEVAKSTAGPTASVLYEGLRHADEKAPTPSRRPSFPTVPFRWASWNAAWYGSRCSSPLRPCSGLWGRSSV